MSEIQNTNPEFMDWIENVDTLAEAEVCSARTADLFEEMGDKCYSKLDELFASIIPNTEKVK